MTNLAIGIDLGGTKILVGLINTDTGEVIYTAKKKTKKELGFENVLDRINESVEKIVNKQGINKHDIKSIGIGAAGQVDRKKGILLAAPNLGCSNINFKDLLEKKFKLPVILGNDVEVATIGEQSFGAGRGCHNFVCIFVGTGVGSGIIHKDQIYHGATGTAGEIGHIIVQPEGRLCGCGNNGCLEAYASRTAISKKIMAAIRKGEPSTLKHYVDENPDFKIRSRHVSEAVDSDDTLVIECLLEAADYLSYGLASVINFYNPERIILGGGLIEAVDFFF